MVSYPSHTRRPSGEELSHTVESLRKEITENLSERMETKQSLLEVQQTNMLNQLEMSSYAKELTQWRNHRRKHGGDDGASGDEMPEHIANVMKQRDAIKGSITDNNLMARRLMQRLKDLDVDSASLVQKVAELSAKLDQENNTYGREVLKLTMERCTIELDNMELAMQTQLQSKIIEKQHELLNQQQQALTQHGIDTPELWRSLPKLVGRTKSKRNLQ